MEQNTCLAEGFDPTGWGGRPGSGEAGGVAGGAETLTGGGGLAVDTRWDKNQATRTPRVTTAPVATKISGNGLLRPVPGAGV
ncbi:hypothetical protein [Gloeomargarita lithophora]|uniref:hypothetical protein n=1 Tax=Gloeomargarita lithophora TaxID=1188228 RepID=UPI0012FD165A|nr:hypothetical protein [Gloeomargarita lithophora]